jgi:hypothetical protein
MLKTTHDICGDGVAALPGQRASICGPLVRSPLAMLPQLRQPLHRKSLHLPQFRCFARQFDLIQRERTAQLDAFLMHFPIGDYSLTVFGLPSHLLHLTEQPLVFRKILHRAKGWRMEALEAVRRTDRSTI